MVNTFVVNFCPSSHDLVTADVDRDVFFRCWSSSSSTYNGQGSDRKKRRQPHRYANEYASLQTISVRANILPKLRKLC